MSTTKPIWIVDDDQSIRFVLEKALLREGLPTRSFLNPKEVLQALQGDRPSVTPLHHVQWGWEAGRPLEIDVEGVGVLHHELAHAQHVGDLLALLQRRGLGPGDQAVGFDHGAAG